MDSFGWSLKLLAVFLLYVVALGTVSGETTCEGSDYPICLQEQNDIATAINEGKNGNGRKLLRGAQSPRNRDLSVAPTLANRRSILAAMCSDTDNSVDAVWQCTNAVRMDPYAHDFRCGHGWAENLPSLGMLGQDSDLMEAARKHSDDQAGRNDLSHTGKFGSRVGQRVTNAGYQWDRVAENIAQGYLSAKSVVFGWMCSRGHRNNILSCTTIHIGIGRAQGSNGHYFHTQVFACPQGQECTCGGVGRSSGGSSTPSTRREETSSPSQREEKAKPSFQPSSRTPATPAPSQSGDEPTTTTPSSGGSFGFTSGSPYSNRSGSNGSFGGHRNFLKPGNKETSHDGFTTSSPLGSGGNSPNSFFEFHNFGSHG